MYAYMSNRIVPEERARISIRTHAFNYGTCAFEGMKAFYLGKRSWNLYRVHDHANRLLETCKRIYIDPPVDHEQLVSIIERLVIKNGNPGDTYIRPMIYTSHEGLGLGRHSPAELAIYCMPVNKIKRREFTAMFSSTVRIPPKAVPSYGKITGMYINSYIAQRDVVERGGQIALLKDVNGYVTEAFGMNLCMIKKGRLVTSPVSVGVLDGITRRTLIELCRNDLGIKVEEKLYTPRSLYTADEVFLCGTGGGINSIVSVDGRRIGNGKGGKITKRLFEVYWKLIHAKNPRYDDWYHVISAK